MLTQAPAQSPAKDDIPPLEELVPVRKLMRPLGFSPGADYRVRNHPVFPLRQWRVSGIWFTTEEIFKDWIRTRTAAANGSVTPPAPTISAHRQREILDADRRAAELLGEAV